MKLLEQLYTTHSPSHHEDRMAKLIIGKLDELKIKYKQDEHLQIYNIKPGLPLMVAHMDQVQRDPCEKVMIVKNQIYGFNKAGKKTGLGADDKNGIWIILKILEAKIPISFIFSACEEAGGKLQTLTSKIKLDKTPYGLIFDRRGNRDIIGSINSYCEEDLETAIQAIAPDYKPTNGVFSDCDELSNRIPCVNLSCGYYNAHSADEYTNLTQLKRALSLAKELIKELPQEIGTFALPEKLPRGRWSDAWYDKYNWNNWDPKYNSPGKDEKSISVGSDPELLINDTEITLIDEEGWEEYFIAENVEDAVGEWDLGDEKLKKKLRIELYGIDPVAWYNDKPISVVDLRREGV
jgi:hypothetical protein